MLQPWHQGGQSSKGRYWDLATFGPTDMWNHEIEGTSEMDMDIRV
jgi:hypothetical protein